MLRGEIVEQAALHGMLDQVQALGLESISFDLWAGLLATRPAGSMTE